MAQGQFTREEALAALNQQWYKGIAGDNHPEEEGKARANQPGRDGEAVLRDLGEQQHPQACPPPPECTPFPVDALDPINNPHLVTENPFNYDPKAQVASNKTLAITQAAEGNIALDHHLSYAEYMFTKNHFLTAIENAKWGDDIIDSYNWFFHNLHNHPLQDTSEQGECTILQYAFRATQKKAYNIGLINEELMTKIAWELDAQDIQSVTNKGQEVVQ
ncbi:hypothetical protein V8B97DRAFT_2026756 [Scleroderma yunnanense]